MKKFILTLTVMLFASQVFAAEARNLPADLAMAKLKLGNDRFVAQKMKHPNLDKVRREKLSSMQRPFAVILSCSDSRVPPEIIFDQGLGDIFVIRNAGNVLDEHVIGSIEYAVHHLGVNLVLVLGHESCGAVGAAMSETKESPSIESIKAAIEPAICKCKKDETYTYDNVIRTHAQLDVKNILEDKEFCEFAKKHHVQIIPAYYSINTGKVEFLEELVD